MSQGSEFTRGAFPCFGSVVGGGEFSRVSSARGMAQLHVTRVKREFREIVTSEEVNGGEGGSGPCAVGVQFLPFRWVRFCKFGRVLLLSPLSTRLILAALVPPAGGANVVISCSQRQCAGCVWLCRW